MNDVTKSTNKSSNVNSGSSLLGQTILSERKQLHLLNRKRKEEVDLLIKYLLQQKKKEQRN